jgi:hypothetical protein
MSGEIINPTPFPQEATEQPLIRWITLNLQLHLSSTREPPHTVAIKAQLPVRSTEQVYVRQKSVTSSWQRLDLGWFANEGDANPCMVAVQNRDGYAIQSLTSSPPTLAEQDLLKQKRLLLKHRDAPDIAAVEVFPGMTSVFQSDNLRDWVIRANGEFPVRFSITVLPE